MVTLPKTYHQLCSIPRHLNGNNVKWLRATVKCIRYFKDLIKFDFGCVNSKQAYQI